MLVRVEYVRRECACGLKYVARVGARETRCFFCTEYEPVREVKPAQARPMPERKVYATSERIRRNQKRYYDRHRAQETARVRAWQARKRAEPVASLPARKGVHA